MENLGIQPLLERFGSVVFFDTETTGLDPFAGDDRIIELAAIRLTKAGSREEMDEFIRLPNGRTLPPKITELTGITEKVLEAQGIAEVDALARFAAMMEPGALLVAHNANFDLLFAATSCLRHRTGRPEWLRALGACEYLDTLTVYKDRAPYPHKLANAITHYGLDGVVKNSHRAIDDVTALLAVTDAMGTEGDLLQWVNVFGYNPKFGAPEHSMKKVRLFPQAVHRRSS